MIVNPVAEFYEFFLRFFQGLPLPFQAYFSLIFAFMVVFAIFSVLSKL